MSPIAAIAGVIVGLIGGIFGGLKVGESIRGRARMYWGLNALVVLVCMLLDFAGLATGQLWLALGSLGLMGGSITGLKYGYSESIGIWRMIDTWTGRDASMRTTSDADHAADTRESCEPTEHDQR